MYYYYLNMIIFAQ